MLDCSKTDLSFIIFICFLQLKFGWLKSAKHTVHEKDLILTYFYYISKLYFLFLFFIVHCDIFGDIRCEELRAAAYDDAKRGMNIQSVVSYQQYQLQYGYFRQILIQCQLRRVK